MRTLTLWSGAIGCSIAIAWCNGLKNPITIWSGHDYRTWSNPANSAFNAATEPLGELLKCTLRAKIAMINGLC